MWKKLWKWIVKNIGPLVFKEVAKEATKKK